MSLGGGPVGVRTAPTTIYDVAALAGVSAQTVSRLIKGFPGISPATRSKVESAISELGYVPNRTARALRTRRSDRLGVLVYGLSAFGPANFVRGVAAEAAAAGYVVSVRGIDHDDLREVKQALATFREEQVAGVIAVTLTDDLRSLIDEGSLDVPVVLDPAETGPLGRTMNEVGGTAAAEHLLDLGHRRFAMISGPLRWVPARQRRDAFVAEVTRRGGTCDRIIEGDWTPASGDAAAAEIVEGRTETAVFAANDAMAIGCIHGLTARGVRVPEDVSVVGFDDVPEAAYITPELTTFRAPFHAEGRAAVTQLLAEIDQHRLARVEHPVGRIVARRSSAQPRRDT